MNGAVIVRNHPKAATMPCLFIRNKRPPPGIELNDAFLIIDEKTYLLMSLLLSTATLNDAFLANCDIRLMQFHLK